MIQNLSSSGTALYGTFDGIASTRSDVLVKYTYFGDANLDGQVDGSDYSRIDANFIGGGTLTGWFNGDFNYDGVVNGSDYSVDSTTSVQQPGEQPGFSCRSRRVCRQLRRPRLVELLWFLNLLHWVC